MDMISARDDSLSRLPRIPDIPHNVSGTHTKLEAGLEKRGNFFQEDALRSDKHINPIDNKWSHPLLKCISGSL